MGIATRIYWREREINVMGIAGIAGIAYSEVSYNMGSISY